MRNVKYNHKTLFYTLFIQTKKIYKQNETKLLLEFIKVFNLLVGGGSKTANHANFMQHMFGSYSSCYFSPLQGNIRKK